MAEHEEYFKPGDLIAGPCTVGHNVFVLEQIHNMVFVKRIYGDNREFWIDVVNEDVHKVRAGVDF